MTESIDYTILMNKIKNLEELNKEYGKIGQIYFIESSDVLIIGFYSLFLYSITLNDYK